MDKRIKDLVTFEITHKGDSEIEALFVVDENLPSFVGHFPDNPILPAVSVIDITLSLISEVVPDVSHSKVDVAKSKFSEIIRPGQRVQIRAERQQDQLWKVFWRDAEKLNRMAQLQIKLPG